MSIDPFVLSVWVTAYLFADVRASGSVSRRRLSVTAARNGGQRRWQLWCERVTAGGHPDGIPVCGKFSLSV